MQTDRIKKIPRLAKLLLKRMSLYNERHSVLEDFEGVHRMLRWMVSDMREKTLCDNRIFEWMEGEPLWYLVAENAFYHEREHADEIRRWRVEQGL